MDIYESGGPLGEPGKTNVRRAKADDRVGDAKERARARDWNFAGGSGMKRRHDSGVHPFEDDPNDVSRDHPIMSPAFRERLRDARERLRGGEDPGRIRHDHGGVVVKEAMALEALVDSRRLPKR